MTFQNIEQIKKEIEKVDKKYGRKLDKLCWDGDGRSKEARQIKKEWVEEIKKLKQFIQGKKGVGK